MLERRKPLELLFPLKGNATTRAEDLETKNPTTLDRLRAGVMLARDAVKAVSLTAMEALREGATFIGIVGETNELVDPFEHLDAPIWSERPPQELTKLAFRYCEELTMREAATSIIHSNIYLTNSVKQCVQSMHFAVVLTTLLTATEMTDSQGVWVKWTQRR